MKDKEKTGVSIIEVAQVVLIILKLTKLIDWTWFQVLLPTIVCWGIALVLLVVIAILNRIGNKKPRRSFE